MSGKPVVRKSIRSSYMKGKRRKLNPNPEINDGENNEVIETRNLASDISSSQPVVGNVMKQKINVLLANWKPPFINQTNTTVGCKKLAEMTSTNITLTQSMDINAPISSDQTISIQKQENSPRINEGMSQEHEHSPTANKEIFQNQDDDPTTMSETAASDDNTCAKLKVLEGSSQACDTKENKCMPNGFKGPSQVFPDANETRESMQILTPEDQILTTPCTPPTVKIETCNGNIIILAGSPVHDKENPEPVRDKSKPKEGFTLHKTSDTNYCDISQCRTSKTDTNPDNLLPIVSDKNTYEYPFENKHISQEMECELNITESQLEIIENKHKANSSLDKVEPQTKSYCFAPEMPHIDWKQQMQENKSKLRAVVRDISQLNAMLTRVRREIWPANR